MEHFILQGCPAFFGNFFIIPGKDTYRDYYWMMKSIPRRRDRFIHAILVFQVISFLLKVACSYV
jgi:hypothetical protein